MPKIRVRAVRDALVPYYLPGGRHVPGRYAGRARPVAPPAFAFDRDPRTPIPHQPIALPPALPLGELVEDLSEYRIAIAHGDLEHLESEATEE